MTQSYGSTREISMFHSYKSGFSLVEIIIGLGLGTIVLYLAGSAVASINQSIAAAKMNSRENQLLLRGIEECFNDIDFWHSHADPRQPYDKGFLHQAPDTNSLESRIRKRPMTKIVFDKSLDPQANAFDQTTHTSSSGGNGQPSYGTLVNPNGLLPHDRRSWYRGTYWANRGRIPLKSSGQQANFPIPQGMDVRHFYSSDVIAATDMRDTDKYGIYNGNTVQSLDDVSAVYSTATVQYLSNLALRLFQRINQFGMFEYLPPGTPQLLNDETGRIPWYQSSPQHPLQNTADKSFQYGYQAAALGVFQDGSTYNNQRSHMHGGRRAYYGMNFMDSTNMYRLHGLARSRAHAWKPVPNKESDSIGGFGVFLLTNAANANPNSGQEYSFDTAFPHVTMFRSFDDRGRITDYDLTDAKSWRSTTVRLPQNPSDHIRKSRNNYYEWADEAEQFSNLVTSILRYHQYLGGNVTINQAWVSNPENGDQIKVKFTALGTNYQGARQHWGVAGAELGYDMGDHYE